VVSPITYNPSIWSGYVDYGKKYSAVSAQWVVPSVTCRSTAGQEAAQWVGIDGGDGKATVEQAGVEIYCPGGGPAVFGGFYEMWNNKWHGTKNTPGAPVELSPSKYPIALGDVIAASVSVVGVAWEIQIEDHTANWVFSTTISSPLPTPVQTTAEWIVERQIGIPNFGSTTFTKAKVTTNGTSGTIAEPSTVALKIVDGSRGNVEPGPLLSSGSAFTDTRVGP
jgi:hypothetical protein